ncbi:MAG: hypothetical protein ACTHJL_05325 [Amnibacterium sp.]
MAAADDPVATAAAELYGLPPEGFVAARTARAGALRKAGDREAASAVNRLPRPTAAASLVDRLVRERPELVHAVLAVGTALRQAQEALDGGRLKELGTERRDRVAEATDAAVVIGAEAGRPPGSAVVEEITATLTAAVLDEAAGGAVASGRLVRALPPDGLEDAPIAELVALPEAPPVLRPDRAAATPARKAAPPAKRGDEAAGAKREAERRDAERAVADAERIRDRARRAEQDAEDDLADADRRRDDAEGRVDDLRQRIADLQQRLDAAEDDVRQAEREVRDRRSDERRTRRAAEDAEDDLTRVRDRLDRLA